MAANMDIIDPVTVGVVFGSALTISRVYIPTVIINQLRLHDFHMLEVFLTASASSALIMLGFEKMGIAKRSVRSKSSLHWFSDYDGNIVGGAILGIGMSLTGACPGTVLPQLVQGVKSARATTIGALLGGTVYAKFGKSLTSSSHLSKDTNAVHTQPLTISSKFNISLNSALISFEALLIAFTAVSVLYFPGKAFVLLPTVAGGLLIAAAQTVSIYLTSSPLGVSAAYEQIGSYICWAIGWNNVPQPSSPPKSILFALGMLVGSAVSGQLLPPLTNSGMVPVTNLQALLGGFSLIFGARMAGGCTSGHGLSGLSAMSYSSLITTTAMFGSGIFTQWLLK
ncbi:hypothetical protein INT43_002202 [Umbelopsis isabellina]|uniref:Sulphur transport domain-containing protein n=1 Tax=Mortierella isabellina TaxID=91625 RepID=A0A8H7UL48_MORIS|nr:hypothetical protein INT43_002202 [Umbelopsis isabellina]